MTETEINKHLDTFEKNVGRVEDAIFDDRPFSESQIKEKMRLAHIAETTARALGNSSRFSVSERKSYYIGTFDEWRPNLISVRDMLKKLLSGDFAGHARMQGLLERHEKCVKELDRLCDVVRNY